MGKIERAEGKKEQMKGGQEGKVEGKQVNEIK